MRRAPPASTVASRGARWLHSSQPAPAVPAEASSAITESDAFTFTPFSRLRCRRRSFGLGLRIGVDAAGGRKVLLRRRHVGGGDGFPGGAGALGGERDRDGGDAVVDRERGRPAF